MITVVSATLQQEDHWASSATNWAVLAGVKVSSIAPFKNQSISTIATLSSKIGCFGLVSEVQIELTSTQNIWEHVAWSC